MENKKIIGWIIVCVGLFVITSAITSTYGYFTGKSEFPKLFQGIAAEQLVPSPTGANQDPQQQAREAMNQALGNIFPTATIDKTLNMIAWSVFATFLVYAGAKVSEVGIKLLA